MVLAVKKWAQDADINDASDHTLSSYSLTLMVIFYLQAGVSPPVLPCLQETHPPMFPPESSPGSLRYERPDGEPSENRQSLGELYSQLFYFYSLHTKWVSGLTTGTVSTEECISRDTSERVISIRAGRFLSREFCQDFSTRHRIGPGQWNAHLLIEDPFDRTNAARSGQS